MEEENKIVVTAEHVNLAVDIVHLKAAADILDKRWPHKIMASIMANALRRLANKVA